MSLIDHFLARLAPYDCLGCGVEGRLICVTCRAALRPASDRCYRCYKTSLNSLTCSGAQSAAREMACLLLPLVKRYPDTLIVHLPTATNRIRQRGYDQARLLARALAKRSRLPYSNVLARSGQTHQVGASRSERLWRLDDVFRVSNVWQVRGARILLVDDVLTTGASFEAATKVLKRAGAAQVDAIAFARA